MIAEPSATGVLERAAPQTSVLINISTPGVEAAICRLGNSEEVISGLTVRELVQRVTSPSSLFSIGVPISQLQVENAAAMAISELLAADSCQVLAPVQGGARVPVALDEQAIEVAQVQTGAQGSRFLNLTLEVRGAADVGAPSGEERRQVSAAPEVADVPERPFASPTPPPPSRPVEYEWARTPTPAAPAEPTPPARDDGPVAAGESVEPESAAPPSEAAAADASIKGGEPSAARPDDGIMTIVAEIPKDEGSQEPRERKEYVRKSDWLRAQFLPEIEALDFSGIFVGNLGMGIREERARRNVVLSDPARITELLLRANGYRRSGDHPKALICYQELVDMDPANADFRLLLGKTLMALGQQSEAGEAFARAKELGHDGAEKELIELKRTGHRPRATLGFLRFWKP